MNSWLLGAKQSAYATTEKLSHINARCESEVFVRVMRKCVRVSFAHVAKVCMDSMCAIICIRERMRNSAKTEKGVVLYATHTCHVLYTYLLDLHASDFCAEWQEGEF